MFGLSKNADSQLETAMAEFYSQMGSKQYIWNYRTLRRKDFNDHLIQPPYFTNNKTVINDFIQGIANKFSIEDIFF